MKPVKEAELRAFVLSVLDRCGLSAADANTTADVLVTTDTCGVFTHGTKCLLTYTRRLRGHGLKPRGKPRVLDQGPAWATVDGDCAIGMVTSVFAMNLAIDKAAAAGIALVVVRHSCHFGAAGYYASLAAARGQIGFVVCNAEPRVGAPGSQVPVLGSNPIAFAAPSGSKGSMVLDIATAAAAGGKVAAAAAAGKTVPPDWLVDEQGAPVTDPNRYLAGTAFLAPMSAHKGYGLGLMVEVLSGALSGSGMRAAVGMADWDPPEQETDYGHAFMSINPALFLGQGVFQERMDSLLGGIKGLPSTPGSGGVKIPGEIEQEKRKKALERGIELPQDVIAALQKVAQENGVPAPDFLR
jgi:LDH2 family malate/lactate/ureidoglycolate dehydrogenase